MNGKNLMVDSADFDPGPPSDIDVLANPNGTMLEASDGYLYGTTMLGPKSPYVGCVFRCSPGGAWNFTVIHSFLARDGIVGLGSEPVAGLVEGTDGALYGTTTITYSEGYPNELGFGTVFKLNKDGSGYENPKVFGGGSGDGAYPQSRLLLASDGAMYGTTSAGGDSGYGTIFVLSRAPRSNN
jgi:uncharacterized repeat protein (TIGR03803 family)